MIRKNKIETAFFIIIYILIISFFFLFISSEKVERKSLIRDIYEFEDEWIINNGTESFETLNINKNELVTYVNVIPKNFKGNCLNFFSINSFIKVYLEDELIYELDKTVDIGRSPGSLSNFVELPSNSQGKEIRIEVISAYDRTSLNIRDIVVGNYSDILVKVFLENILSILINVGVFFIGIALLILFVLFKNKLDKIDNIFYLGIFALSFGLWSLSEIVFLQIFFKNATLKYYLCYFSLFVFPLAFLLYMKNDNTLGKTFNKINNIFIRIHMIILCVLVWGHFLSIIDFTEALPIYHILLFFEIILMAYFLGSLFLSLKPTNKITKFIIKDLGSFIFIGFEVLDLLRYYIGVSDSAIFSRIIVFGYTSLIFINTFKKIIKAVKLSKKVTKYKNIAYFDSLTGLNSRTAFEDKKKKLEKENVSIVYMDVNLLKYYNDNFGHEKGDELLMTCSNYLKNIYGNDNCYRIGGDEFVVLLQNKDYSDALNLTKKFHKELEDFNKEDKGLYLEVAYGIIHKSKEDNFDEALNLADSLMYKNKNYIKTNSKFRK